MSDAARTMNWRDVLEETVLPGITRAVVHGERQTIVRYRYEPDAIFPEHSHPQEQVTVVISGRIAFDVAGERRILGPGDVAVIPGGVPHGAEVIGPEVVDTINALSPRRETAPTFAAHEPSGEASRSSEIRSIARHCPPANEGGFTALSDHDGARSGL